MRRYPRRRTRTIDATNSPSPADAWISARSRRGFAWLSVLALLDLSACELVAGYRDFRPRTDAGADRTSSAPCQRTDFPRVRDSVSALLPGFNGTSCFWIDENEVTQSQYDRFLDSNPAPQTEPPCLGNTTYVPAGSAGAGETCRVNAGERIAGADRPVVCVDWCDAEAYCRWAGKSLCRDDYTNPGLLSRSDWYAACANGTDESAYPYLGDFDPRACNGNQNPSSECDGSQSCGTRPVQNLLSCKNDEGVFDLSGNAAEWTEACQSAEEDSTCEVRGGSFRSDSQGLSCSLVRPYDRRTHDASIGFRCCWYP